MHGFQNIFLECNLFALFYNGQVLQSENPKADEIILSNMAAVLDRVLTDVRVSHPNFS